VEGVDNQTYIVEARFQAEHFQHLQYEHHTVLSLNQQNTAVIPEAAASLSLIHGYLWLQRTSRAAALKPNGRAQGEQITRAHFLSSTDVGRCSGDLILLRLSLVKT
jgi:hypothetical protein